MQQGSVYKRCAEHGKTGIGGKRACQKKHGSWYFTADGRPDPKTGKRKQITQGGFKTQYEADDARIEHLASLRRGATVDDRSLTVGDWLEDWVLMCQKRVEKGELEEGTLRNYRRHVRIMKPLIGHHRLMNFSGGHVAEMISDLRYVQIDESRPRSRADGRIVEERSTSTLESYRRTLRAALNDAILFEKLKRNNVAERRPKSLPAGERPDTTIWQPEQTSTFLLGVAGEPDAVMWDLALYNGMRRGEVGGLSWASVDLESDNPGLKIGQTLSGLTGMHDCYVCGGKHRGRRLKPRPKSERSMRWAPLLESTVLKLRALKEERALHSRDYGKAFVDHGLVFCEPDGQPIRPDAFSERFKELSGRFGLPDIRLHDTRHGVASVMKAAGIPRATIAQMLGHSEEVDERIYTHQIHAETRKALEAAATLIRAPRDRQGDPVSNP